MIDWDLVKQQEVGSERRETTRLCAALYDLAGIEDGFPVNQMRHCLQTAVNAERDGASTDLIIAAAFHDIGKLWSRVHHGEVTAWMFTGKIAYPVTQVLRTHGTFTHDRLHGTRLRKQYVGEVWFKDAARFCEWDADAFDPNRQTEDPRRYCDLLIHRMAGRSAAV